MDATKQIVLVVGAGASCEYGFPSGTGLRDWIFASGEQELVTLARALDNGFTSANAFEATVRPRIVRFIAALRTATTASVDQFLTHRPEFREVACRAIALKILGHEASLIRGGSFHQGPYRFIGEAASRTPGSWPPNLKVINFNYERSLQYVVASMIAALHGEAKAASTLESASVSHVHGSFSMGYQWVPQAERYTPINRYSRSPSDIPPSEYAEAAKEIRIIGEDGAATDQWSATLGAADSVVFLGFGFHKANLELLGFADGKTPLRDNCSVYATAWRLPGRVQSSVKSLIPSMRFGKDDQNCSAFLEYLDIL